MNKSTILFLLLFPLAALAQYTQEWQVSQNPYEMGSLYFDLNHDGYPELTKYLFNTNTVYDGAHQYQIIWSVVATNHDELILWELYRPTTNGDTIAVFLTNNYESSQSTHVMAYNVFGANPLWNTTDFPGYYSYLAGGDLDNDSIKELALGMNIYNSTSQSYACKFYVLNSANGAVEFQSTTFDGFMIGPYLGDLDGDHTTEILLNLYHSDSTSTLRVYSYQGSFVDQRPLPPESISLEQNYPNPFNATTTIPLRLIQPSHVTITIVNVQGRVVSQIIDGTLSAGQHLFQWNGRDESGVPIASGMYFYEVSIDNQKIRKPMVLLK